MLISTALGTIGSGTLADRYGRRVPLILSSALSVPTILLFAEVPGLWVFLVLAQFLPTEQKIRGLRGTG